MHHPFIKAIHAIMGQSNAFWFLRADVHDIQLLGKTMLWRRRAVGVAAMRTAVVEA